MEKKAAKNAPAKKKVAEPKEIELKTAVAATATSPSKKRASKSVPKATATVATKKTPVKKAAKKFTKPASLDVTAEIVAEPQVELSPAFKVLAEPVLPELKRENRARLMMQTPTRAYFYWSLKENPYHLLRKTFGDDTGSYILVSKLTDLRHGVEEIHPAEADGNWWYDVEPDREYEAEIGFYAPNRPYFRVIYSNTIETPRRRPSRHAATESDWNVSANKFAEVLDVAGFTQDAFDVAMAGDDHAAAENTSQSAFSSFLGGDHDLGGIAAEDIRYVMLALASGATLEDLRFRVSPALFAILQANADKLEAGRAMSTLTEYFNLDEAVFSEEHQGAAVYGSSLVNFPRTLKTRGLTPVSSHSLR